MSIFFWIKPTDKNRLEKLGLTVRQGKGENRWFIESRDNPFDPTAEMHRIPQESVLAVSLRQPMPTRMRHGRYASPKAEMLVLDHRVVERVSSGFFTHERNTSSLTHRAISIFAQSLEDLIAIFRDADAGKIKPSQAASVELISKFERQCA